MRYAERILHFIEDNSETSLSDIAFTSQLGRMPMSERLVIIADDLQELKEKLTRWIELNKERVGDNIIDDEPAKIYYGSNKAASNASELIEGNEGDAFLSMLALSRDLQKLAKIWISGIDIDWSPIHKNTNPRRISLPTYPFDRKRYWIDSKAISQTKTLDNLTSETKQSETKQSEIPQTAQLDSRELPQRIYYFPEWKATPLNSSGVVSVGEKIASETIWVLDSTNLLSESVRSQLASQSITASVVSIKFGNHFEELTENNFVIDPAEEKHFAQLCEMLQLRELLPGMVIHQCFDTESKTSDAEYLNEDLNTQLEHGVFGLFHLYRALMERNKQGSLKVVSLLNSYSTRSIPQNVAIASFFKSLTLENPKFIGKTMAFDSMSEVPEISLEQKVDLIIRELNVQPQPWNEIKYQYDPLDSEYKRFAKKLSQYSPQNSDKEMLPLKQNGVYLITGGLGGIGFIFSRYLAERCSAKLVLLGRSKLNSELMKKLRQLKTYTQDVLYIRADVSKPKDVELAVAKAKQRFKSINGIVHSAGINKDSFMLKKTRTEFEGVLSPKIFGTLNLDQATRDEELDLFVVFSSIAGVMGNLGQSDYAFGNQFLDSYAENREARRLKGQCSGRTLSINWPYWEKGGMEVAQEYIELAKQKAGMWPLATTDGIQFFEDLIESKLSQGVAIYGKPSLVRKFTQQAGQDSRIENKTQIPKLVQIESAELLLNTQEYLRDLIGTEIKLAPELIDVDERLESFGIDSVMINSINVNLERDFGELPKTLIYEYETIAELSGYLVANAKDQLVNLFGVSHDRGESIDSSREVTKFVETSSHQLIASSSVEDSNFSGVDLADTQIAIIGLHSQNPESVDLEEFWANLKLGKDLIKLVPANRWDQTKFYDADPERVTDGKIYCKWGGFLEGFDKFDPEFFNISPSEAKVIDPQERIFLQSVWSAIEDAGYTPDSLKRMYPRSKSADVGVFAGVTTNSYQMLASEEWNRGNMVTPGAMPWSIANRVSYYFDFQGPSMPVDTACSSSLVAIHLACESLKNHECKIAIAGGVNLYLHQSKYHSFCQRKMLAVNGKCRSFGAGDDGFIPSEGVGAVVLKELKSAIADHDNIYAVVRGSAFDHSGRSNGYSAPNPNSQASLIGKTLELAKIKADTIGYVEGHGTGTQLGDSLEVAALTNAFSKHTEKKQYCALGSVKGNIGHSESAAGIAGLAKVLMQLKHKQLVPTIHSDEPNPDINFGNSPFYLQHELSDWTVPADQPRRALINSFGAGGVNACLLLEEFERIHSTPTVEETPESYLIVLSAKKIEGLYEYIDRLLVYLNREDSLDLFSLAYTLQVGREAMTERLAIVVADKSELIQKLSELRQAGTKAKSGECNESVSSVNRKTKISIKREQKLLGEYIENNELNQIARIWLQGAEVTWEQLYKGSLPSRISAPSYPFARDRYWLSDSTTPLTRSNTSEERESKLHPLLSFNSSTLREVNFTSVLSRNAFYATDHRINNQAIFPGSCFIEIACIAGNIAGEQKVFRMKDIVWAQPLSFEESDVSVQTILKTIGDATEYEIVSLNEDNERVVHSEGRLFFDRQDGTLSTEYSIQALKSQCEKTEDGSFYYQKFEELGFEYGPAFRTLKKAYVGDRFALAELKLSESLSESFDEFILHPSIIDAALQSIVILNSDAKVSTPHIPF
ncbi:MAG: SDR family NAD(P)-dependent oxidoreductase, partial [Kangiellaceae bacterium]|nr:SDR family NAD(P)-dependent oxidoreductase [Kangiellaceae bacterium]